MASIKGYDSVYFLRAGAYGDGTLVDVSLPLKFSFRQDRSPGKKWGLTLHAKMTALELSAGIFYQWKRCQFSWWTVSCQWGDVGVLYEFGKWSAFTIDKALYCQHF